MNSLNLKEGDKEKMKKRIALTLAIVMLMSLLPISAPAFAVEEEPIAFPVAPVGNPYEGLPLFDGVPRTR